MMTAVSIACPPPSITSSIKEDLPRKRRRRQAASGASDDCFACTIKNRKCDRRRPYCSQCLEHGGRECSGYKTQLTWGVGVASRGKLRGLSLPVAKSAPVATMSRIRAGTMATSPKAYANSRRKNKEEDGVVNVKIEAPAQQLSPTSYTTYDFISMAPSPTTSTVPPSPADQEWSVPISQEYLQPDHMSVSSQVSHQSLLTNSLHHLQAPLILPSEDMGLSTSADTISTYSSSEYASPTEYSYTSRDFGREDPIPFFSNRFGNFAYHTPPIEHGRGTMSYRPTSYPDQYYTPSEMSSSISSAQNMYDSTNSGSPADSSLYYEEDILGAQSSIHEDYHKWNTGTEKNLVRNENLPSLTSNLPSRTAFLLDYFEKFICPKLVLCDSPSNPYRKILTLAMESESLQHAVSCLSAVNLYNMRKQDCHTETPPDDDDIQEETHHHSLSLKILATTISDPTKASHDSVLSTLLVLMHYRICKSGVANFNTQFIGARKLIAMRGMERWGWMERLLGYFDATSAMVNDRDILLGDNIEMASAHSEPSCSLENLTGCDSTLFKIIARLGSLNLMSQNRPVAPPHHNNFHLHTNESSYIDDHRSAFWQEWTKIRTELQNWKFDPNRFASNLPIIPTSLQLRDFSYLSQLFRYASLLYIERLANPESPSSNNQLQNLLSQFFYFLTKLSSTEDSPISEHSHKDSSGGVEGFLLWPLFIAGSESINEVHRSIIREKLKGCERLSGYQDNFAILQLLEKMWTDDDRGVDYNGHTFRWTRYMEASKEYIMV